jgi:hypothetical protein
MISAADSAPWYPPPACGVADPLRALDAARERPSFLAGIPQVRRESDRRDREAGDKQHCARHPPIIAQHCPNSPWCSDHGTITLPS